MVNLLNCPFSPDHMKSGKYERLDWRLSKVSLHQSGSPALLPSLNMTGILGITSIVPVSLSLQRCSGPKHRMHTGDHSKTEQQFVTSVVTDTDSGGFL